MGWIMEIVNLIVQAIAAVGSVLAAFAAWQALKVARQANDLAEETAAESADHIRESNRLALEAAEQAELHAREAEKREEMRDQRRIASNMQAWWVKETKEDSARWGIILSNTGADNAVFYNVDIRIVSNSTPLRVNIATLPPGQYFLESCRTNSGSPTISYPESIRELRGYQPLLKAKTHAVQAMEFTDQVGQRWQWTRKTGLAAV